MMTAHFPPFDTVDDQDARYMPLDVERPVPAPRKFTKLTTDAGARKAAPMARGLLDYFPLALMEVARTSAVANEQHNPGTEVHWDRTKSTDHADCLLRHLVERGRTDTDGLLHSAKVAWRALAMLQTELEQRG